MAFRAVIFDIGGVLEVTPSTGWQRRWARELGLTEAEFDARLDPIWAPGATGDATLAEIERGIAAAFGLDAIRLRALMDDAWSEYLGTLDAELAAYVTGLRPRYRTGILSNSFVGAREREQAAYGFAGRFDAVVYSHEEGVLKPDPEAYAIVCERLAVAPAQAVFVDDTPACVEGAEAFGMRAVRFVETRQAIADLQGLLPA